MKPGITLKLFLAILAASAAAAAAMAVATRLSSATREAVELEKALHGQLVNVKNQ